MGFVPHKRALANLLQRVLYVSFFQMASESGEPLDEALRVITGEDVLGGGAGGGGGSGGGSAGGGGGPGTYQGKPGRVEGMGKSKPSNQGYRAAGKHPRQSNMPSMTGSMMGRR